MVQCNVSGGYCHSSSKDSGTFLHRPNDRSVTGGCAMRLWKSLSTCGSSALHFPWASCQIRKIVGCACAGNVGNAFPHHRLQRKPLVNDAGMYHGTCATHVPWCMPASLTRGGGENVHGIPDACASRNVMYLARGPYIKTNSSAIPLSYQTILTRERPNFKSLKSHINWENHIWNDA